MRSFLKHLAAMIFLAAAVSTYAQAPSPAAQQPQPATPPDTGVVLQVEVRAVLVPVVVRDAQGHAVGDLTQKDFKVYDQGKARTITGFNIERGSSPDRGAPTVSADASSPAGGAPDAPSPRRFIVFLFDDRHLGPGDLLQIQKAATQMLNEPLAEPDRGVVLSFLGVNSGMTRDHAVLQAAVMKLKASTINHNVAGQCPAIDYFTADAILNQHSKSEWDIAYEKTANCSHQSSAAAQTASLQNGEDAVSQLVRSAAQQALEIGNQDVRDTLSYLRDVVHTMQKLPGQRTLILISPGFFSNTDEALNLQSQILNLAAASNVTISALDPQGLFNGFVGAGESTDGSVYANITGQPLQNHLESARESEDIMAKLADGTGGTFFHNGNNLAGGLKTLVAGPEYRYVLEVSLQDVKPNGAYHSLKVEVARKDVKIQAREGYFAPRPEKIKK